MKHLIVVVERDETRFDCYLSLHLDVSYRTTFSGHTCARPPDVPVFGDLRSISVNIGDKLKIIIHYAPNV